MNWELHIILLPWLQKIRNQCKALGGLLIVYKERRRYFHGPAFVECNRKPLKTMEMEAEVLDLLARVQPEDSGPIPPEINMQEEYGISLLSEEVQPRGISGEDSVLPGLVMEREKAMGVVIIYPHCICHWIMISLKKAYVQARLFV